mmetsp:Transcript_41265/g.131196  ORF Transcript_41265/g.131196 Transcript_41265/m.131196 type:complete len:260 (+) Transcript_41265:1450-2229(+)
MYPKGGSSALPQSQSTQMRPLPRRTDAHRISSPSAMASPPGIHCAKCMRARLSALALGRRWKVRYVTATVAMPGRRPRSCRATGPSSAANASGLPKSSSKAVAPSVSSVGRNAVGCASASSGCAIRSGVTERLRKRASSRERSKPEADVRRASASATLTTTLDGITRAIPPGPVEATTSRSASTAPHANAPVPCQRSTTSRSQAPLGGRSPSSTLHRLTSSAVRFLRRTSRVAHATKCCVSQTTTVVAPARNAVTAAAP